MDTSDPPAADAPAPRSPRSEVERLTKTETRYRLLVEAVIDYAIYMLDTEGFVVSWNSGAQRLKGYTESEILGRHFSLFHDPEDVRAGLPQRALATAQREGRLETEGWRVRKDGGRFWAHVVIDRILSPEGELIGFAKVTRDLSERRAAEESLRRSEQQFKLLVQGVTDYAIYMLDPHGIVTNWNVGAQRIKGYLPDEIVGSHFSRFYPDEEARRGDPERALAVAAREGRFESEGWRLRKDGSRFWAAVVIDAIRDAGGEVIGFAKVTRDVTEKREAQRALEVAREALFQSQKLDAIGQLTGGVAHDFNNLLMVVLGSLELARRRLPADDERLRRFIDNAISGARRGASLTQRMLAFARRQELKPVAVDLAALVLGMSDLLTRSLGPLIRIETEFPPALPPVMADPNQLELAILNLAVNARDAMPKGGPLRLTASEHQPTEDLPGGLVAGAYLCLSVQDRGAGMDEATLARATEPFFTTKGVGKGTGLGLPMVHGLAAQSGGQFLLRSVLGEGTTAELWLPLASPEAVRALDLQGLPESSTAASLGELRVMVVDDDPLVLSNTVALLEELGHQVRAAASAPAALEALQRGAALDLLITDHAMPGMSGAQLIEAVRLAWPALPTVLATGYAELPSAMSACTVRLAKPFSQHELLLAIEQALRLH